MKVYPKVLFLTNRNDLTVDYVIVNFKKKGIPYLRVNSDDIHRIKIVGRPQGPIEVYIEEDHYSLEKLNSIYFRRAPSVFPEVTNSNDREFVNRERRNFLEGLYLSINARWVNPIYNTYLAERKLYQLYLANKIGFKIPRSITSNDPTQILKEFPNFGRDFIIKPISHGLQVTPKGTYSVYTSEINDMQPFENGRLFECPVLVQDKIPNSKDIRVTVIGKKLYAVEISKDNQTEVDWRKIDICKSYKIHVTPKVLDQLIFELNDRLGLVYSAFDFILTPNGEYVFLETNPAGEWLWLENELKIPICNTIIDELIN